VSTVLFHGQNVTSIQDLFQPNSWQTPVAAVTVYSAPEDGHKGRPKHVEHTCSFNKHNTARVASCWFIIYYRLVMHGNSNIELCSIYLWSYFFEISGTFNLNSTVWFPGPLNIIVFAQSNLFLIFTSSQNISVSRCWKIMWNFRMKMLRAKEH
jgi:hypothetical protein